MLRHTVLHLCSLVVLALLSRSALALDPTQPTASYLRTTFTVEDGLPDNVVNAILQSRDGFLWIGTYAGLVRFNGRDFMPVDFHMAGSVSQVVVALAEGPDGSLWVGTDFGVVRIHDVEHYEPGRHTSELYRIGNTKDETLQCLKFTRGGTLFAGTGRGLYRLDGASFVSAIQGINVQRVEEEPNGHLLIVADNDFLEWDRGRIIRHPGLTATLAPNRRIPSHGIPKDVFHYVMEDRSSGAIWYCSHWDIARQGHDPIRRNPPCASNDTRIPIRTYNYGQGTLWANEGLGVFRVQRDSVEPLLTHVAPRSLLEDRDGNLWIGTNGDGLIQLRDRPIHMFTTADGLPTNVPMTVLARHDGTIWVGNNCGGLSRFDGKRFVTYAEKDGLLNSCVWALAEDGNDDLWIGTWGGGAFRFKDGKFEQYAQRQGLPGDRVRSIVAAPDGSLWIATNEGLSRMRNGHLRNYTAADGLSSNDIIAVYADRHGGILAASSAGIDRLTGDRFVPLSSPHQIVDPHFIGFGETLFGELYAFSAPRGISRIDGNRLVSIGPDLDLLGMAEFRGQLWFSSRDGILRVPAASGHLSWEDRSDPFEYAKFGRADGLNSTQCSLGAPNIIVDQASRLWVPTVQGLAMIDLLRLAQRRRPPTIFIEEATVDQRTQPLPDRTVLPPGNHHVELKFDAIELTSPERVRFQYRLDGVDATWLDAGTTRTAVYTSVPIGKHLFHVRACNSDGIWDHEGIAYGIIQTPFFYETNAFRLIVVAVLIVLGAGAYRLRVRQIAAGMHARFDERLAERTRIARELHDTLLQSFQGLLLRFQAVSNLLPNRPDEAKHRLDGAIDQAAQAITEGRDAVRELRASTAAASDLDVAISTLGEELIAEHEGDNAPVFHLQVEGTPRDLQPILRDEVYRIGSEALRNAFRHGRARRIEAEIRYDENQLRLRFRDDGKGIDTKLLNQDGEPGHWGLPGMRERAKLIGGRLDVWSELDSGTEVELNVPASLAYATSPPPRPMLPSWLGKAFSRKGRAGL